MVDKVLSELAASGGPFVLIIDDLHELSSGYDPLVDHAV
jgi:hypothetical protein